MEEEDIVGEQTAMLLQVYGSFSKLFNVMPSNLQSSFLELGAKFDIDDDFNMLNEKAIEAKTYYAPDKFALLDKSISSITSKCSYSSSRSGCRAA